MKKLIIYTVLMMTFVGCLALANGKSAPVSQSASTEHTAVKPTAEASTAKANRLQTAPQSSTSSSVQFSHAALQAVIEKNRVFDGDVTLSAELLEEAMVTLLPYSQDGDGILIIKRDTVDGFIRDLYGIEVTDNLINYETITAPEGYYPILPRGYVELSHSITEVRVEGDITAVYSTVTVTDIDCYELDYEAVTILKENPESPFGYNIISASLIDRLAR